MNFLYIFKFLLSFSNFTLYFTKGTKYRWLLPFRSNINRKGLKIQIPASHFLQTVHASFGRLCCCVFCQVPTRAELQFLLMLNILWCKNVFLQRVHFVNKMFSTGKLSILLALLCFLLCKKQGLTFCTCKKSLLGWKIGR